MIDVFLSFTKEIVLQKNQTLEGRVEEILVEGQSKQST